MSVKDEDQIGLGIHSLSAERYFAAKGVSKSMLDILADKTPAHLIAAPERKVTDALRFGVIFHRALLEPDTYSGAFHVRPDKLSFATKEGKEWRAGHCDLPVLTHDESNDIKAMQSSVLNHPFAKRLLFGGVPEQCLFVEDTNGTLRKSRLDVMTKGNVLSDIKTTESASLENFERSISKYRLHVQAAYYLDNCNLAGIEKVSFFFICVEKSPPYLVRCLQLMPEVIEYGRTLYQRDLQVYRNCLETGLWPGWGEQYDECALPSYEMRQLEQVGA